MRVTTDERMSSKIFIEFIALIRCRFNTYLKDKFRDNRSSPNWSTVSAALRELEKIKMIRCYDSIYRLDHTETKKQKKILYAFGISGDNIKLDSKENGKVLTIQKRDKSKELSNGKNKEYHKSSASMKFRYVVSIEHPNVSLSIPSFFNALFNSEALFISIEIL